MQSCVSASPPNHPLQVEFWHRELKQPQHLILLKKASQEKINVSSLEEGWLFLWSNMR